MDRYVDAAKPYGKTVNAFMVMEGWRIRHLVYLIAISLICSICVVAIATAVSHSLDAGLTAGTYAIGLATAALTAMTILSVIV